MLTLVAGYGVALVLFVVVDLAWLATMAPRFYRPIMGDIAAPSVNMAAAVSFYALYPIGLMVFAIAPALRDGQMSTAAIYGALFGFFTYATYNLTAYAVLRNWTTPLAVVDIAWGTILAAVAAVATTWIVMRIFGL